MKKINVAVIGHTHLQAMELIPILEKNSGINLIPKTIGNIRDFESISFHIGIDGKSIKLFPLKSISIFLKYKNLTVIDFTYERNNVDFYARNNIRFILPDDETKVEDILKLIFLN